MSSEDNSTPASAAEKRGKSSAIPADQQVKFLLSCIRNSVNGKIDFAEVAKECEIVSKGAAAKRYERLLKAANIEKKPPPSPADTSAAATKSKAKKAGSGTAATANKKRKITETETSANEDEGQDYAATPAKKKQAVKKERRVKSEVKEEATDVPQSDGAYDVVSVVKGGKSLLSAVKTEPLVCDLDAIYDTVVVADKEDHRFPAAYSTT
ncbi:MAG: hypothetical protein Q9173_005707 [Seirophora scorigena]